MCTYQAVRFHTGPQVYYHVHVYIMLRYVHRLSDGCVLFHILYCLVVAWFT